MTVTTLRTRRRRPGERRAIELAEQMALLKPRILDVLTSYLPRVEPSADGTRWPTNWMIDLDRLIDTGQRLRSDPDGVPRDDINDAVETGAVLEALLRSDAARQHVGKWVVGRGPEIVAANEDLATLEDWLRKNKIKADVLFWVGEPGASLD